MAKDDRKQRILARRARFMGAALAGSSLVGGSLACDSRHPEPCLSTSKPCLSISRPADTTTSASTATSAATTTRAVGPRVCLQPVRPPTIYLANKGLDDAGLAKELASGNLDVARATRIELAGNRITAQGLKALARALKRPIQSLNLENSPIGDAGAKVIATEAIFKSLGSLSLPGCGLTKQGVAHLYGKQSILDGPQFLDLSRNSIGDAGVAALSGSEKAAKINEMYLAKCDLSEKAIESLAGSPHFAHVFGLWLQDNGLDSKAVEKLRTAAAFKGTRVKLE